MPKSKNGTDSTETNSRTRLSGREICSILKECRGRGLKRFLLSSDSVEIEFYDESSSEDLARQASTPETVNSEASQLQNPENDTAEPPKVLLTPEDEEGFKVLGEMQLMLDDPLAFEQSMIDEQLEDDARGMNEGIERRRTESTIHGGGGGGSGNLRRAEVEYSIDRGRSL